MSADAAEPLESACDLTGIRLLSHWVPCAVSLDSTSFGAGPDCGRGSCAIGVRERAPCRGSPPQARVKRQNDGKMLSSGINHVTLPRDILSFSHGQHIVGGKADSGTHRRKACQHGGGGWLRARLFT